jgi:hypothetical protein
MVSIELRIVSRPRDRAHIKDPLHTVRLKKADEVFYRPCRVTDREDDERCHVSSRS